MSTPALTSGRLAILPGDLGWSQEFLAITFAVMVAVILIGIGAVYWSNKHPHESRAHTMGRRESIYTVLFLVVVMIFASSTLGLLPYPYAHPSIKPTMVVNVRAQQFQWCIAPAPNWGTDCQAELQIPLNSIVLFNTSSIDVNHGFGLYSSTGQLLDQVQVMPGFYNNIIYQFKTPGTYYVRCLEFCGYGHFGMVSQLDVV